LNESEKKAIEAKAKLSEMSTSEFIRQAAVRAKPMSEKAVHPTLPEINYKSYMRLVEIKQALVDIAYGVSLSALRNYPLPEGIEPRIFAEIKFELQKIGTALTGINFTAKSSQPTKSNSLKLENLTFSSPSSEKNQ